MEDFTERRHAYIRGSYIVLYKANGCWVAWHKGECGKEIQSLFGTDCIPTAFTDQAKSDDVRMQIQALNPRLQVNVAQY